MHNLTHNAITHSITNHPHHKQSHSTWPSRPITYNICTDTLINYSQPDQAQTTQSHTCQEIAHCAITHSLTNRTPQSPSATQSNTTRPITHHKHTPHNPAQPDHSHPAKPINNVTNNAQSQPHWSHTKILHTVGPRTHNTITHNSSTSNKTHHTVTHIVDQSHTAHSSPSCHCTIKTHTDIHLASTHNCHTA